MKRSFNFLLVCFIILSISNVHGQNVIIRDMNKVNEVYPLTKKTQDKEKRTFLLDTIKVTKKVFVLQNRDSMPPIDSTILRVPLSK